MEGRLLEGEPKQYTRQGLLHAVGWLILLTILFSVWIILSRIYPALIPTPYETIKFLVREGAGKIGSSITTTVIDSLAGFAIALALAMASACISHINSVVREIVNALNTLIQSVSVLIWTLVLVMIFGVLSRAPPILVTAAATYPILLSSITSGFKYADEKLSELARVMGASRFQELMYFIIPGSMPYIVSASRSALGLALRISVVAEAFGGRGGVGYQLMYYYDLGVKEGVFAWGLLMILLMIIIDYLALRPVERWFMRWRL